MIALPDVVLRQLPASIRHESIAVTAGGEEHTIHVMRVRGGGDGPRVPVLMLHGNPTWGFLWRKVVAALEIGGRPAPGLDLIIPDLAGLGYSSTPTAGFHSIEHHGAVIRAVLDSLGIGQVVLAIQDWGGPIGLHALADSPERLLGLVILNTVIGPPKAGFRATAFHRFARVPVLSDLAFTRLGFAQRFMFVAQGDPFSLSMDALRAYDLPLRGSAVPLLLARMVPDSLEHPSVQALQRCQDLALGAKVPVAIVWGDRDPVLGPIIYRLEKQLPHAHVVRTRAGHFIQEEAPEAIAAAIRRVVAQLNPSR